MKKLIFILLAALIATDMLSAIEISFSALPENPKSGSQMLIMENGTKYLNRKMVDIKLDNNSILVNVISKTTDYISFKLPENITVGQHIIRVDLSDDVWGTINLNVVISKPLTNDSINGQDPDPKTQNGKKIDIGKDPKPIEQGEIIRNPSGGYPVGLNIPCSKLHRVDGKFTDSVYQDRKEWSGIFALPGKFSRLFLDYCDDTKTMYVLNDWFNGTGRYDSNSCYNRFEFKTGGGAELWQIRVFHSITKPIEVFRNGLNVTKDSNYVIGGGYNYGKSPYVDSVHTMYEFGIKVISGVFFMPVQHDPYSPPQGPTIEVVCDEGGVDGYGLVQEPGMLVGTLGDGFEGRRDDRYIPISDLVGLTKEPNTFSGELLKDSMSIRKTGETPVFNKCIGNHVIDGYFTNDSLNGYEWSTTQIGKGKFSNLYAEYCSGVLYIMNDWVLATEEPDEKSCYNVFELWTGNDKEHWGIFVYHNRAKGIKIFRNGVDVTKDSNFVLDGKFGFGTSPLESKKQHTMYEFGVKAKEGTWFMDLSDPGPATFCDEETVIPRPITPKNGIRELIDESKQPGDPSGIVKVAENKSVILAVGTSENTSDWFSRKFKAKISFDPAKFDFVSAGIPNKHKVSDIIDLKITRSKPGVVFIEGLSTENFNGSGDLFYIYGLMLSKGQTFSSELNCEILLGNRTSYLRTFTTPKLVFDVTTDIEEQIDSEQNLRAVNVYPNPSTGNQAVNVDFSLSQSSLVDIRIFDVLGNVVPVSNNSTFSQGINQVSFETKDFLSGVYFIKISSGTESKLVKFDIMK